MSKVVALYLRKSRDEEHETREATLARHERMLFDYCSRNNLNIVASFKEVVSGESLDARPQARAMLEAVANNEFDGVVCVDLERLSRGNQIDQVEIMEVFKKSKTKIYTLNKIYDLACENEFDEDFFEFGLFMSRREYKIIKRRLLRGKKQAQKEGYYIGSSLPFGFGKIRGDKGFILVPNDETPAVQLIFQKFAHENYSLAQLRDFLDASGIKPQRLQSWTSRSLRSILSNKCYIGFINYNSRSTRTQECYVGKHKPIIDEQTWDIAQRRLASSSFKVKKSVNLLNPLASLVKCSVCGATMQLHTPHIRCLSQKCPTVMCYLSDLEAQIIDELSAELKDFNYFIDNYGAEIEKQTASASMQIEILQTELKKRDAMLDKACEMLELGVYTLEKYKKRVSVLEEEKTAIDGQISALLVSKTDELESARRAVPILERCIADYWSLSPEDKNALLKSFIDRVEYSKTERNNRWHKNINANLKIYLKI